jgi:hypothetical protein
MIVFLYFDVNARDRPAAILPLEEFFNNLGASGASAGPGYPFQSFLPALAGKKGFPLYPLRISREPVSG